MSPMLAFGGSCWNGHMVACPHFSPAAAKERCPAMPYREDMAKQTPMSPWQCLQNTTQDAQNLSVVPTGHGPQPPEAAPSCKCLGCAVQTHRLRAVARVEHPSERCKSSYGTGFEAHRCAFGSGRGPAAGAGRISFNILTLETKRGEAAGVGGPWVAHGAVCVSLSLQSIMFRVYFY